MECEAAVVGEQGGEGDQARLVVIPVLLEQVAGGGEEEGGAADVGVSDGVAAVSAGRALQMAAGVQLAGPSQRERQGDGLERLGRCETHEWAVVHYAAPPSSAEQAVLLLCLR